MAVLSVTSTSTRAPIGPDSRLAIVVISAKGIHQQPLRWPEDCVVGRVPPAHVCIDDPSVSRAHARLRLAKGVPVLEDLGSRNGTFINNQPVGPEGSPVAAGDALRFGSVAAQIVLQPTPGVDTDSTSDPLEEVQGAGAGEGAPEELVRRWEGREVIVADPAMVHVFRNVERVARLIMPVLVTGETGTGKEIVSEAVHALGPRAAKPLVKLNCAAVPENLLESELFGHERGAFSGATAAKPGLIERAHEGTLFLDEIGEMPLPLQAKILRVVEDRRVLRLGATKDRPVDVRIVAATHRDPQAAAANGRFREDLYYRLNILPIRIPPLRERPREILLLARRFAQEAASAAGRPVPAFTKDLARALERHPWPGNIRELRNAISQAVVFCEGDTLDAGHVGLAEPATPSRRAARATEAGSEPLAGPPVSERPPRSGAPGPPSRRLHEELRTVERGRILEALEACGGNQTKAAELLEMPRRTLVSRMAALGIVTRRQAMSSPGLPAPPSGTPGGSDPKPDRG